MSTPNAQFFVDTAQPWNPSIGLSCHLITNGTPADLHAFAAKIGLKREWFQDKPDFPHYDLIGTRMHGAAIEAGALSVTGTELVRVNRARNQRLLADYVRIEAELARTLRILDIAMGGLSSLARRADQYFEDRTGFFGAIPVRDHCIDVLADVVHYLSNPAEALPDEAA